MQSIAHLGAQAEAEAVGKARGHVVEDAGAVNLAQELLRRLLVLCGASKHSEFRHSSLRSYIPPMKLAELPLDVQGGTNTRGC